MFARAASETGMIQFLISFEYEAGNDTDDGASLSTFDGICARVSFQCALSMSMIIH
jgi:hypothetical protein